MTVRNIAFSDAVAERPVVKSMGPLWAKGWLQTVRWWDNKMLAKPHGVMDTNRILCPSCSSEDYRLITTAQKWEEFEDGGEEIHTYRCLWCQTLFRTQRTYQVVYTSEETFREVVVKNAD